MNDRTNPAPPRTRIEPGPRIGRPEDLADAAQAPPTAPADDAARDDTRDGER